MEDDMAGPKDGKSLKNFSFISYLDYIHHYTVTKVEAKKIFGSQRFQEITAKFW